MWNLESSITNCLFGGPQAVSLMIMPSHGNAVLLALCEGNPPVTSGSPHNGPVMQDDFLFDITSLNKLLEKQSGCRWFEIPWCLYDINVMWSSADRGFMESIVLISTLQTQINMAWYWSLLDTNEIAWWHHEMETQGSTLGFLAVCPKSHFLADTEISLYIDI